MARSKYNVTDDVSKRTFDDIVFDSEMEMKYYKDVILPAVKSGEIIKFERQKRYLIQPSFKVNGKTINPIYCKADFYVMYKSGKEKIIEIKGFPTDVALLKRKLFLFKYPNVDYTWITFKVRSGWVDYFEKNERK